MVRIAKLEKAYRENPDTPLFARLADSYLERGSIAEAQRLCEEGCERFPDYPTGFAILSKCYEAQAKLEDARQAMDRALRLDPGSPRGYLRLSQIYEALGISTLALKNMQKALSLDPFNDSLAEQLDELALTVGEDPEGGDEPSPAEEQVSAPTIAAETVPALGEPAEAATEPVPEIDLELAAQSGMQDYPDVVVGLDIGVDLDVSVAAESEQQTLDPFISTAADAVETLHEETPLEVALTSLETESGDAPDSLSSLAPDLLLASDGSEEVADDVIPVDAAAPASDSPVSLEIDTLTLAQAQTAPQSEELADLGAAILGVDATEESDDTTPPDVDTPPPATESESAVGATDVDLIAFTHEEGVAESSDPGQAEDAGDLISLEASLAFEEEAAPTDAVAATVTPVDATAPADATALADATASESVELISFDEEDSAPAPQKSTGAVELISFDDEDWEESDDEADAVTGSTPPDSDTGQNLFEFENHGVVAAAGSRPEGDAGLVDLFQEIEERSGEGGEGDQVPDLRKLEAEGGGVTETLAQIYASQGLIQRAIDTYRQLLERQPDNEQLRQRLEELERGSDERD